MKHNQAGTFTYAPPRAPEPSAIARNSPRAKGDVGALWRRRPEPTLERAILWIAGFRFVRRKSRVVGTFAKSHMPQGKRRLADQATRWRSH